MMGYVPPVRPSGIITLPPEATYQQFETFRRDWVDAFNGRNPTPRPIPLTGGNGRPSMDFYHLMNTGLLFSWIALFVAILYAVLSSA